VTNTRCDVSSSGSSPRLPCSFLGPGPLPLPRATRPSSLADLLYFFSSLSLDSLFAALSSPSVLGATNFFVRRFPVLLFPPLDPPSLSLFPHIRQDSGRVSAMPSSSRVQSFPVPPSVGLNISVSASFFSLPPRGPIKRDASPPFQLSSPIHVTPSVVVFFLSLIAMVFRILACSYPVIYSFFVPLLPEKPSTSPLSGTSRLLRRALGPLRFENDSFRRPLSQNLHHVFLHSFSPYSPRRTWRRDGFQFFAFPFTFCVSFHPCPEAVRRARAWRCPWVRFPGASFLPFFLLLDLLRSWRRRLIIRSSFFGFSFMLVFSAPFCFSVILSPIASGSGDLPSCPLLQSDFLSFLLLLPNIWYFFPLAVWGGNGAPQRVLYFSTLTFPMSGNRLCTLPEAAQPCIFGLQLSGGVSLVMAPPWCPSLA